MKSKNNFYNFLFQSFSLTEPELIQQCPWRENKIRFIIGLQVLITACFAGLSFSYALSFFIQKEYLFFIIFLSLIWFILILNIDRILLYAIQNDVSESNEISIMARIFTFLLRVVMAVFVTTIITVPIELKIFENEVNENIINNNQILIDSLLSEKNDTVVKLNNQYRMIIDSFPEYKESKIKVEKLWEIQENIENKTELRPYRYALNGRDTLIMRNFKTAEYQQAINDYNNANEKLNSIEKGYWNEKKRNDTISTTLKNDIINDYNLKIEKLNDSLYIDNLLNKSLVKRINSLKDIRNQNPNYKSIHILIWAILILIEILPTLLKLLIKKGKYERLLELQDKENRKNGVTAASRVGRR